MESINSSKTSLPARQFYRTKETIWPPVASFFCFLFTSLKESLLPWTKEGKDASPTAYLDGLRGYAALFVSLYHLRNRYTHSVHVGFGFDEAANSVFQLPIARLIFAGQEMVIVFFVVSGCSLALSTFGSLKADDAAKALERIRSSIFRRFVRLYLPTVVASFLVCCCIFAGMYQWGYQMNGLGGYQEPEPLEYDSILAQLGDWAKETALFLNIFQQPRHLYYPQSWSIPIEFVKSLQLYVLLIALCKLNAIPRAILHVLAIGYCHYYGAFTLWTFLVGAGLAHIKVMLQDRSEEKDSTKPLWQVFVKSFVFLFGLYMLSYPEWGGK